MLRGEWQCRFCSGSTLLLLLLLPLMISLAVVLNGAASPILKRDIPWKRLLVFETSTRPSILLLLPLSTVGVWGMSVVQRNVAALVAVMIGTVGHYSGGQRCAALAAIQ